MKGNSGSGPAAAAPEKAIVPIASAPKAAARRALSLNMSRLNMVVPCFVALRAISARRCPNPYRPKVSGCLRQSGKTVSSGGGIVSSRCRAKHSLRPLAREMVILTIGFTRSSPSRLCHCRSGICHCRSGNDDETALAPFLRQLSIRCGQRSQLLQRGPVLQCGPQHTGGIRLPLQARRPRQTVLSQHAGLTRGASRRILQALKAALGDDLAADALRGVDLTHKALIAQRLLRRDRKRQRGKASAG